MVPVYSLEAYGAQIYAILLVTRECWREREREREETATQGLCAPNASLYLTTIRECYEVSLLRASFHTNARER